MPANWLLSYSLLNARLGVTHVPITIESSSATRIALRGVDMPARIFATFGFVLVGLLVLPLQVGAQVGDTTGFLAHVSNEYRVVPNVTYHVASNAESKLDLYLPRNADGATPVLMYIHGGGWVRGTKESNVLRVLPYLEMGWSVVNVEYRMADVAHAPAAVEDCRCALRWVYRNAERYNFDVGRIVVTGNSAGGHLSLTTGMLTESAGLDRQCPGDRNRAWSTGTRSMAELKVAAIINWYGITDVVGLMQDIGRGMLMQGLISAEEYQRVLVIN